MRCKNKIAIFAAHCTCGFGEMRTHARACVKAKKGKKMCVVFVLPLISCLYTYRASHAHRASHTCKELHTRRASHQQSFTHTHTRSVNERLNSAHMQNTRTRKMLTHYHFPHFFFCMRPNSFRGHGVREQRGAAVGGRLIRGTRQIRHSRAYSRTQARACGHTGGGAWGPGPGMSGGAAPGCPSPIPAGVLLMAEKNPHIFCSKNVRFSFLFLQK